MTDSPQAPVTSHSLTHLVAAANAGDTNAWNNLVERFRPLVYSVVRKYRLNETDGDDVSQNVWMSLVIHLKDIREPRALPGWITTTTRNEALRVISDHRRTQPVDPQSDIRFHRVEHTDMAANLLAAERRRAVRTGLDDLRPRHRELILLLLEDPDISYIGISRRLGIPCGSIGPTRARVLEKLQATKAIRALAS